MPRKKEIVRVSTQAPRFRQDTPLMKAHETMVDFIKGGSSANLMDFLDAGIFEFINNGSIIEVDPDRDLIYSDDDDEEDGDFSINFNHRYEKPLEPHPRIKELDDETEKRIRNSNEEEEKRKLKAVKNKRKKMRKKEKKRQEKAIEEKKVLSSTILQSNFYTDFDNEAEKSDSSETEEVRDENTIIYNKKKELNTFTTEALCNKRDIILKEEKLVQITKKIKAKSENSDLKPPTPCITESEQKSKDKSIKLERAPEKQSVNVKQPKKEEPKVNKPVKAQKKEKAEEIKKEENQEDAKEKTMDSVVEEYAKRSREIAALGNQLAATGQYEMAVKCFTDAIKFNPKEYKLFGNRSFCFEKLQQFESALSDAEVSLSMEPSWIKGLFRKGKALCGLKKFYEATLAFKEVLKLESSSQEAMMELKRAQILHLMEMGFTWVQSSSALKKYGTLEEAVEALFKQQNGPSPEESGACKLDVPEEQAAHKNSDGEEEEWIVPQSTRPKTKTQFKGPVNCQSSPVSRNQAKLELFPVWVGSLASTVTYATLHEVFNRVGNVVSVKMVLEHQCAFVNYTKMEDADRAVHTINGMVLEGCPLLVRYPSRIPPGIGVSKNAMTDPLTPFSLQKKECFFWRTIGCTRDNCTFKHFPENKGIDREKYTGNVTNSHF